MKAVKRFSSAAIAIAALFAFGSPGLAANPFLAEETPIIRAPSSGGALPGIQLGLRNDAAEAIRSFARHPSTRGLMLLFGLTLAYGMLHAAGPGHRKTVVFSLFLGRKARPWEPLAAGFLAAGIHGASGIAVVAILSFVRGAVAGLGQTERISSYLDAGTYAFIGVLALILAIQKIVTFRKPHSHHGMEGGRGGLFGVVAAASVVPCPGAVMLLLFAIYAGQVWLGVLGVVSMSIGMGIVISAAGYLAYAGREGLFKSLKARGNVIAAISSALELASYLLLLIISLYALSPLLASLWRGVFN